MRTRPSSRLVILDPTGQVLLFRFTHTSGALAGRSYWATPGGGVEQDETFGQAAVRELAEETGIVRDQVGDAVAQRQFEMLLPDGERVLADERFFIVQVDGQETDFSHWTAHEQRVISHHRWWSLAQLQQTDDPIFPHDLLIELLSSTPR